MSAPSFSSGILRLGDLLLGLFLLPLEAVDPFVFLDPHLVQGGRVAVGGILEVLRGGAQQVADATHDEHQVGHVDPEGAVHGTAPAQVALGVGDLTGFFDEGRRHAPLVFDDFPEGLLHLGGRRKGGVVVVGEVEMTGLAAQATVDTGLQIGFQARAGSRS